MLALTGKWLAGEHVDRNIQKLRSPISNHLQIFPPESPKSRLYPEVGQASLPVPIPGTPMSTVRQIEANRRNSRKSTGPTSVTGKAISSMNALQTGIHAKSLVLSTEKLADLELLIADYYQRHHPASPEARFYVDELIRCEWTLRRLCAADTQMWEYQNHNVYSERDPEKYPLGMSATCNPNSFSRLQYRLDATRRAYERALQSLRKLKAEAPAAPLPTEVAEPADPPSPDPSPQTTSPQIGFVPPTPVTSGADKTDMGLRRSVPETRCQSCLSPVSARPTRRPAITL